MDSELNEHNVQVLQEYSRFFKQKVTEIIKEISLEQQDLQESLIIDQIFNQDDVEQIVSQTNQSVNKYIEKELNSIQQMNIVYVKLLLQQAQKKQADLYVDIDQVQNIEAIGNTNQVLQKKVTSKLPTLQATHKQEQKITDLEQEIRYLKEKNSKLMNDFSNVNNEGTEAINKQSQENEQLRQELEKLKLENEKKLSESVQVSNLKKMLQQKNQMIKELQEKLKD